MSREVKSIELIFENCEAVKFEKQYIGHFVISGIERMIRRCACNSISDDVFCKEVFLELSSKTNIESSCDETWYFDNNISPFERIRRHNDITHIIVNYEDGTEESIGAVWDDDSDYSNPYQTSAINEETGDLYLVISKDSNVHKFFDESLHDNVHWYWEMYED